MFLLIVAFPGKTEYYGPFINEERAEEYGRACKAQLEGVEDAWVKPLNTPAREHSIMLRRVE
jgi:hypothetical protein